MLRSAHGTKRVIKYEGAFFLALLVLSTQTALLVTAKNLYFPPLGLLKDFVIACLVSFAAISFGKISRFNIIVMSFAVCLLAASAFSSHVFSDTRPIVLLYQSKIELFYLLTFVYLLLSRYLRNNFEEIKRQVVSVLILFGVLNSILAIVQRHAFSSFLGVLGYDFDGTIVAFGHINGLVIQTQNGLFRAIGSMSTPMASAEFSLLALFLFLFTRRKFRAVDIVLAATMIYAIYCTGYKTAFLSLAIVLLMCVVPRFGQVISKLGSVLLLIFGFLSVNTKLVYDVVYPISPSYAKYSISLREDFVRAVYGEFDSALCVVGCLNGKHGNYFGDVVDGIPLDSIYIYIAANYGLIGLLICVILISYLFVSTSKIKLRTQGLSVPVGSYVLVVVCGNFFWNQPFVNFPSGWHLLVLFVLALHDRRANFEKSRAQFPKPEYDYLSQSGSPANSLSSSSEDFRPQSVWYRRWHHSDLRDR